MSVSENTVRYVANLARLELTPEEISKFTIDLSRVLGYIEMLNEIETEHVKPLLHVMEADTQWRTDAAQNPISHENALKNAPDADTDYFKVPRVIE